MGTRHDDRSSRRHPHVRPPQDAGRAREGAGRAYDRGADMGGSGWSGASGRGGMGHGPGGYPHEDRYRQSAYRESGYLEGGYPRESASNTGNYPREGDFPRERGFGHVPGQRWGGGYGGDAYRGREGAPSGEGFSGSDFGPPRDLRGSREGYGFQGTDMGMGAPDEDRGPYYGKGPKGYKRPDTRIHDDVCEAIASQGYIDASDVEVKVESGIVTLSGTVMHREDKKGLERLVESTRGVEEVHNELRLQRHVAREAAAPSQGSGDGTHRNGKSVRSS